MAKPLLVRCQLSLLVRWMWTRWFQSNVVSGSAANALRHPGWCRIFSSLFVRMFV